MHKSFDYRYGYRGALRLRPFLTLIELSLLLFSVSEN